MEVHFVIDAQGVGDLLACLETCDNGRREDVLGTLFPCSEATTRFNLLAKDEADEHVETAEGEEEEGRDEGEAVNVMG